jgi:hypothetical protein
MGKMCDKCVGQIYFEKIKSLFYRKKFVIKKFVIKRFILYMTIHILYFILRYIVNK